MVDAGSFEPADVCVVGAGPAGITAALRLSDAGRSVLLLESGGTRTSRSTRRLNDGETAGDPYQGLMATRHRGVGGTVNIWNVELYEAIRVGRGDGRGAKYVPLSPRDLAGWPIEFDELLPWYETAQGLCGLGPFDYEAARWTTPSRAPFDLSGTGIESGVYQFGTARRFTNDLVGELRRRPGVTLVQDCTVVGLEGGASGRRIERVLVATSDGATRAACARSFVLACGAIENARLLLTSGVGEGRDWLGRGFMEHARDFSLVLEPGNEQGFARAGFYDLHVAGDGTLVAGRLKPTPTALREHDLPNASITLVPQARKIRGPAMVAWARRRVAARAGRYWSGRYGWSALELPDRVFETFALVLNLEHLPSRTNRVELTTRTDRFGTSLPRVHLRWTDAEQVRLERLRLILADGFDRAGLGRLRITPGCRPNLNAHHHAGTTRMGVDARAGVVDREGRVFGTNNLFVAGASVFPSAGFANPTLTIVAMSLRLAAHIDRGLD